MATPAIQTLITDAQQVLNLKSLSEIRATLTAVLANANVGTPLNPNLTTQQLWDEFYEIVRQTPTDIESILVNQMMKFVFSPPAPGGAGANGQVIFNDGGALAGDAGLTYDKTTDSLTVLGNVGIGVTPNRNLDVRQDQSAATIVRIQNQSVNAAAYSELNLSASGNNWGIRSGSTAANSNRLEFVVDPSGTNLKALTLDTSGNLSLLSDKFLGWGNLDSLIYGSSTSNFIYFRTNATEQVRIDGSGNVDLKNGNLKVSAAKGIDFSLNPNPLGMTSELLNDYEEGTFTAAITFGGGSTGITYSQRTLRYTKVGRVVSVQGLIVLSNKGSSVGQAVVTGLPFNINNSNDSYAVASIWLSAVTPTAGGSVNQAYGVINTAAINLSTYKADGSYSNLTDANFANNSELMLNLTYTV